MAEQRRTNTVSRPSVNRPRIVMANGPKPFKVDRNLQLMQSKADELQKEADRLNSFRSLAWQTIKGIPKAPIQIVGQTVRHPIRTAGHIGTGIYNEGIRPILNIPSYLGAPKAPKIEFQPQNSVEEGIQKGFGVGGQAGAYYAGTAALRPLLEAPKVAGMFAKISPKLMSATSRTAKLKPLAQELIGDQIVTQALTDSDASWKERAASAVIAPAMTLGLHALGRGKQIATRRVKEALGARSKELGDIDLSKVDLNNASDDEIFAYYKKLRSLGEEMVIDPRTGTIDIDASIAKINPISKTGKKFQAKTQPYVDKAKSWITSGRAEASNSGPAGQAFVRTMDNSKLHEIKFKAVWRKKLEDAFSDIKPEDYPNLIKAKQNPALAPSLNLNQAQRRALQVSQELIDYVDDLARKNGWKLRNEAGEMVEWKGKPEGYFPQYLTKEAQADIKTTKEILIKGLMEKGYGRGQAELMAAAQVKAGPHGRIGVLENTRVADDPRYNKNFVEAMLKYVDDASKMEVRAKYFGQEGEKIRTLVDQMSENGFSAEKVQKLLDDRFGGGEITNQFIRGALKWNQATKLPLSGIQNLTQMGNTTAVGGLKNTVKSLWKYATDKEARAFMKDFGQITGALDQLNITQEAGISTGRVMDFALAAFKWTEKMNRIIAADVSKPYASELLRTLADKPGDATALRLLTKLGLGRKQINAALKRGFFDESDFVTAGYNFVANTQFHLDAMNLPIWSRSPMGKLFTQFKSFGFMQTKFYRDELIREAKMGNYKPLARMLAVAPPLFLASKHVRDIFTIRDAATREKLGLSPIDELTPDEEDQKNFDAAMGMTGMLPAQLVQSLSYAQRNAFGEDSTNRGMIDRAAIVAGNILGPTVSDIGAVARSMSQGDAIMKENRLEDNPENYVRPTFPLERTAINWIPYFGPGLKNTFYRDWPERERQVFRKNLKDGITKAYAERDPALLEHIFNSLKDQHEVNVYKQVKAEVKREQMKPEDRARYESIQQRKKDLNNLPFDYGQVQ